MAQGRGSGDVVLAVLLLCVLLHGQVAESAVFTVGDRGGWAFNTNSWTNGKRFKAGDVLVFKYGSSAHNVVAVNAAGYKGCTTPRGAKVYKSGNDRVTLARGTNYFICNFPGHCQSGMKIAVTAA
ncbi:basic blue protein-like [Phragmites australis]|uniref:basic blue protein-like n=1 Tax=Phragmites australis TaxID=29695 RepID=UPI002D77C7C2|nr:basic blue protein-like [Phragmites australis]